MKMKRSEDVVRFSDVIRKYENMLIKTPRPIWRGLRLMRGIYWRISLFFTFRAH